MPPLSPRLGHLAQHEGDIWRVHHGIGLGCVQDVGRLQPCCRRLDQVGVGDYKDKKHYQTRGDHPHPEQVGVYSQHQQARRTCSSVVWGK
jgi:hypothetical protein